MSEQIPRPEAAPSRPQTPNRRLALHIPNTYPRVTSPRSSPMGSPLLGAVKTTEEHAQGGDSTRAELAPKLYGSTLTTTAPAPTLALEPADERTSLRSGVQRPSWWHYLRSETTSGESSRDFLARERTYFSWLRLSTLLAIAAVALFLRLRLRTFPHGDSTPLQAQASDAVATGGQYMSALARKAMRKRMQAAKRSLSAPDMLVDAASSLLLSSSSQQIISPPSTLVNSAATRKQNLEMNPAFSTVLGSIFFVLAVVSLLVGHIDYMRCERALELADKPLPPRIADTEGGGKADQVRWHDAQWAKRAHSSRFVRIVEITIAVTVFATALIILITNSQEGDISPLPPGVP